MLFKISILMLVAWAVLSVACDTARSVAPPTPRPVPTGTPTPVPTDTPTPVRTGTPTPVRIATPTAVPMDAPTPVAEVSVLVAAGDIALCGDEGSGETALVVAGIAGTVAALGDTAYEDGTSREFAACYEPTWGRHKDRTRPAPGNHEYHTEGAAGYYAYFGDAAGTAGEGFYSYDLGAWHIVVLNSECPTRDCVAAQEAWLRADLDEHAAACTLAYWHRPVITAGPHDDDEGEMLDQWRILYDHDVDLVLTAHDHNYQRYGLLNRDADGTDPAGIRQIIIGTGGRSLTDIDPARAAGTVGLEVWADDDDDGDGHDGANGVVKFTLRPGGYEWRFVPVSRGSFQDSGSDVCH